MVRGWPQADGKLLREHRDRDCWSPRNCHVQTDRSNKPATVHRWCRRGHRCIDQHACGMGQRDTAHQASGSARRDNQAARHFRGLLCNDVGR